MLTGLATGPISLDSPEWRAWLETHQPFAVTLGPGQDFSVRWRSDFGAWAAYRTLGGVRQWVYLSLGAVPQADDLPAINQALWDKFRNVLSEQQVDDLLVTALAPLAPLLLGDLTPNDVVRSLTARPARNRQDDQARAVAVRLFTALQRAARGPLEGEPR